MNYKQFLQQQFKELYKDVGDRSKELIKRSIKTIYYNEKKGTTIVVFKDGTKIIKHTIEDDNFDLNVGVALCLAEYIFGSKNQFHKKIKEAKRKDK